MPQMSPINWLFLFLLFSMIFLMFNVMNYYSLLPMSPKQAVSKSFKTTPLNWKW